MSLHTARVAPCALALQAARALPLAAACRCRAAAESPQRPRSRRPPAAAARVAAAAAAVSARVYTPAGRSKGPAAEHLTNNLYFTLVLVLSRKWLHTFVVSVMQPVLSKKMVMRTVRAALRELALPMTNDRRLIVVYYIAYVSFLERVCDTNTVIFLVYLMLAEWRSPSSHSQSLLFRRLSWDIRKVFSFVACVGTLLSRRVIGCTKL
jgi:hypothetical protein